MNIKVLDKGYIRLVDTLGTDLSIVNAARVSYDKEAAEFTAKDASHYFTSLIRTSNCAGSTLPFALFPF